MNLILSTVGGNLYNSSQYKYPFGARIRHYFHTDEILQNVLSIVANKIKQKVIARSLKIPNPESGAVSFIQSSGNTLNFHLTFILLLRMEFLKKYKSFNFHEALLTQDDIADAQDAIETSVLRLFNSRGWFNNDEVEKFSLTKTRVFPSMAKCEYKLLTEMV